ncbi:hypothetical protein NYZ21_21910, partial [Acinetobacter baumannii]|nr:hypothetical protein [Acinetobacter baumannii]
LVCNDSGHAFGASERIQGACQKTDRPFLLPMPHATRTRATGRHRHQIPSPTNTAAALPKA